jgi:hypothetical protein
MKTILNIIIIFSGIFFTKTSFAQTDSVVSIKERIILLIDQKEYDSIIAYSLHYAFPPPPIPTVESLNNQYHYDDVFLVCFKNDSCYAICMAYYDSGIGTSNRILIQASPEIDTLRQYWPKIKGEYFKPFVYKHKQNGKVLYDKLGPLHPMYGELTFKSRGYYETKDFLLHATEETFNNVENNNYKHNSSLHLYTVYKILERFYNSLYKQFVYHK